MVRELNVTIFSNFHVNLLILLTWHVNTMIWMNMISQHLTIYVMLTLYEDLGS